MIDIISFLDNKITVKYLLSDTLTELGGYLYPYLCMLRQQERIEELAIVENYRNTIFAIRNRYQTNEEFDALSSLENVNDLQVLLEKVSLHLTMLRADDKKKWENAMLSEFPPRLITIINTLEILIKRTQS